MAKKTFLFQEEVDYLGFRVSANRIGMQDSYVERILNWPTPTSVKQLNSLFGFLNYYRSFIKDFSILTSEMNAQRKENKLKWTDEIESKFHTLRSMFAKKPIQAYPRYGEKEAPFELWPDYSKDTVGHVLQQVQDEQQRLIAAGGRKTTPGEKNYAPTKGE